MMYTNLDGNRGGLSDVLENPQHLNTLLLRVSQALKPYAITDMNGNRLDISVIDEYDSDPENYGESLSNLVSIEQLNKYLTELNEYEEASLGFGQEYTYASVIIENLRNLFPDNNQLRNAYIAVGRHIRFDKSTGYLYILKQTTNQQSAA